MGRIVDTCGFFAMVIGGFVSAFGLISVFVSAQNYGLGREASPFMVLGSGLGVFTWGALLGGVAEILRRLPPPPEQTEAEPRD